MKAKVEARAEASGERLFSSIDERQAAHAVEPQWGFRKAALGVAPASPRVRCRRRFIPARSLNLAFAAVARETRVGIIWTD